VKRIPGDYRLHARFPRMPFVAVAGRLLEYEWLEAAEPGRPTLVFLHEGLGSIRQWRDFPLQVVKASGCRALVYSRYGYGQSEVLREAGGRTSYRKALRAMALSRRTASAAALVGHSTARPSR
jgi:pimeloyl-ACP methyl ester carboxylesterase